MNSAKLSNQDAIWDLYINSYIVDNNIVWSGPNAQPLPLDIPIHIITACNPFGKVLTDNNNSQRNLSLQKHIDQLSLKYRHVISLSPNGDWQEASFAIYGSTREKACDLAQAFDQRAIFELIADELLVIDANSHEVKRRRPR